MKDKSKQKDAIIFLFLGILTAIIYNQFITMHYAADTYNIMNIGYTQYAMNNSFVDGRIIMGIIMVLADFINMPMNLLVIESTVIALFLSCLSVMILKNMMLELRKTENLFLEIIAVIISYITVFNFMYVENLYFIEAVVMAVGILMYILAVRQIVKKEKLYYIKALGLVIIGTFCYQGIIGLFLAYGFIFSLIKNKDNKKAIIKDLAIIASLVLIAYVINMLQIILTTKILGIEQKRLSGITTMFKQTKYLATNFVKAIIYNLILNCCGLFPTALMVCFVIAIFITTIIYEKKYQKEKIPSKITIIIIAIFLITIVMSIVGLSGYASGRIQNQIGALIGFIYMYLFCNTDIFYKDDKIKTAFVGILIVYSIITIVNICNLINQHRIVNNLEEEQCKDLEKYIQEYEIENDVIITEAKYFKIDQARHYFNSIPNRSVLTYNAVVCNWSSTGTINFYTNRNFENEKLEIKDNIELLKKYIKLIGEGYDTNFVIIDNVLYYTVFI